MSIDFITRPSRPMLEAIQDAVGILTIPRAACRRLMARQTVRAAAIVLVGSGILQSAIIRDFTLGRIVLLIVLDLLYAVVRGMLVVLLSKIEGPAANFQRMFVVSAFLMAMLEPLGKLAQVGLPGSVLPTHGLAMVVGWIYFVLYIRAMRWAIRIDTGQNPRTALGIAFLSGLTLDLATIYLQSLATNR